MTWNPTLHRWEGNESVLRDFDNVLSSSTRPALITHLSTASPARLGFPSLPSAPLHGTSRANAKVVGSMMFDPVRMSWYSILPEGEDELDLAMGEGELADDEGELGEDGWEKGEQARLLKNRASFVMSEGSRDGESEAEEGRLWAESLEGERRHREEMSGWSMREEGAVAREWLWDLRTVRFVRSSLFVLELSLIPCRSLFSTLGRLIVEREEVGPFSFDCCFSFVIQTKALGLDMH